MSDELKLNLGCGTQTLKGWLNLDIMPGPGVDIVADLDQLADNPLDIADNSVVEFRLLHLIEHLANPLSMMEELHRVAAPNAKLIVATPHGSSDLAWADPTHLRPYFVKSFYYFAQPIYTFADYGYRGDWQIEHVTLRVSKSQLEANGPQKLLERIEHERNHVSEMVCSLRAIKPVRPMGDMKQFTEPQLQFHPI